MVNILTAEALSVPEIGLERQELPGQQLRWSFSRSSPGGGFGAVSHGSGADYSSLRPLPHPQPRQPVLYFGSLLSSHTGGQVPLLSKQPVSILWESNWDTWATCNGKPGPEGGNWAGRLQTCTCDLQGGWSQNQGAVIPSISLEMARSPLSLLCTSPEPVLPLLTSYTLDPFWSEPSGLAQNTTTSMLIPSKTDFSLLWFPTVLYTAVILCFLGLVFCLRRPGCLPMSVTLVFIHLLVPSLASVEYFYHHLPQPTASQCLVKRIWPTEWLTSEARATEGKSSSLPSCLPSVYSLKKKDVWARNGKATRQDGIRNKHRKVTITPHTA